MPFRIAQIRLCSPKKAHYHSSIPTKTTKTLDKRDTDDRSGRYAFLGLQVRRLLGPACSCLYYLLERAVLSGNWLCLVFQPEHCVLLLNPSNAWFKVRGVCTASSLPRSANDHSLDQA